jgi:hypothetical protein
VDCSSGAVLHLHAVVAQERAHWKRWDAEQPSAYGSKIMGGSLPQVLWNTMLRAEYVSEVNITVEQQDKNLQMLG